MDKFMEATSETKQNTTPPRRICAALLAHVDAGKTTLSEAMLYTSGAIRRLGRVDKGDAFLDTYELEKKRGITIFSKQARLSWRDMELTLLDTPGHVDFSAEMERTLQVLDYAVLVISGSDGVQSHTRTLWRLLARYRVPVFLFINKMDLAGERKTALMEELKRELDGGCVDFGEAGTDGFYENAALCREEALNQFLETGQVEMDLLRDMIRERELFPCYFGSALKLEGVEAFLEGMETFMEMPCYPDEFGARVFKIARDNQGNRLTYLKMTGGTLAVRDVVDGEKVNQLRVYSGERFEAVKEVQAGMVCAVTGLANTTPGQGLGMEAGAILPVLEPVLTYRILLPEEVDAAAMLPKLLELEEEEPELHIAWNEEKKEIHAQLMGEIQMEILRSLIAERFGVDVKFGERSIVYKETIRSTAEGVGHFEPLRHYAEVHLLLEPGEPGSGLVFGTACSEDILGKNWQRLVMTHLEEKEHRGVLTGSAITDMRITLVSGRAHVKHTEGGDFRQAVYRAVRQGLMQADCALLEPFYEFRLEIPERFIGRALTDLERRFARFETPEQANGQAVICGSAPVASLDGYQSEVTAYSGGLGRLSLRVKGYGPCHNELEVIEAAGYNPDADLANPSSSVFCAHGAGFVVEWYDVKDYMHLEWVHREDENPSDKAELARDMVRQEQASKEVWLGTDEIDAILRQTYQANKKDKDGGGRRRWGGSARRGGNGSRPGNADQTGSIIRSSDTVSQSENGSRRPENGGQAGAVGRPETAGQLGNRPSGDTGSRSQTPRSSGKTASSMSRGDYLLVDGYNIIFSWEELKELAAVNIDSARGKLLDILSNYQGIRGCSLIAVFDAYRVQGHPTEIFDYHNIHVVFTKEAETADQYIEKFAHENGRKHRVTVATSDRLEQIIIRGQGCGLLSARELEEEIARAGQQLRQDYGERPAGYKHYLLDGIAPEMLEIVKEDDREE